MLTFYQYTSMAVLLSGMGVGLTAFCRIAGGLYDSATTQGLIATVAILALVEFALVAVVKVQYLP